MTLMEMYNRIRFLRKWVNKNPTTDKEIKKLEKAIAEYKRK